MKSVKPIMNKEVWKGSSLDEYHNYKADNKIKSNKRQWEAHNRSLNYQAKSVFQLFHLMSNLHFKLLCPSLWCSLNYPSYCLLLLKYTIHCVHANGGRAGMHWKEELECNGGRAGMHWKEELECTASCDNHWLD